MKLYNGDCLEVMRNLPDASVEGVVTDPPYGLNFMGEKWDKKTPGAEIFKEALRVLKPGGHIISCGGTRTYHRMACTIEDAGFEIRDMLEWIYNTGFSKSHNIGKAYDKKLGNEREEIGKGKSGKPETHTIYEMSKEAQEGKNTFGGEYNITKGYSQWEGYGTAIKPAHEPMVLARKPISEKSVLDNCIKHGTGAIDIDGCRIPTSDKWEGEKVPNAKDGIIWCSELNKQGSNSHPQGRFPANLLVTDDALNDGKVTTSSGKSTKRSSNSIFGNSNNSIVQRFNDSSSKSRYFDIDVWAEKNGLINVPKPTKSERNKGCEGLNLQNSHPTVKPVHLMAWLVRLITREGDTVLDPFTGSGTTGMAAKMLSRDFIGIEKDKESCDIAEKRIKNIQVAQGDMFNSRFVKKN